MFGAPQGGPLRYSVFRSRVWAAMVTGGVDVRTAQNRLGHSDPRLTIGLYAQATTGADASAARRLGEHVLDDPAADSENAPRGSRGVGVS